MQWQKLKGIISFLSNIFHVMLAPQYTKRQLAKEIFDNDCMSHNAAPPSPFTTVYAKSLFICHLEKANAQDVDTLCM